MSKAIKNRSSCENYLQLKNERGLEVSIQATPVVFPIKLIMKNERNIKTNPAIAKTKVFLDDSIFFGSPPEVMYLIPDNIIKITAIDPERVNDQNIRLAIKGNIQSKVAT